MRPLRLSVLVVFFVLLLSLALALSEVETPIPVAVEPVFAGSIEDPKNHPPVAAATIYEDPKELWTDMPIKFSSNGSYLSLIHI